MTPPTPPSGDDASDPDRAESPERVPAEPANPWAPPAQIAPPAGAPAPPPPARRTSRAGLVVASLCGVLLLVALSTAAYLTVASGGTAAGDCLNLTGTEARMRYEKLPCGDGQHNYTVSKVLGSATESCGADPGEYATYSGGVFSDENLCLIPVYLDGHCYDFSGDELKIDNRAVDCGTPEAIKAKVVPGASDEYLCGEDAVLALGYPETKTLYCFTSGS
ncbi:LppU/SCO3897 family protein [Lentzea sp. NPDC055074]